MHLVVVNRLMSKQSHWRNARVVSCPGSTLRFLPRFLVNAFNSDDSVTETLRKLTWSSREGTSGKRRANKRRDASSETESSPTPATRTTTMWNCEQLFSVIVALLNRSWDVQGPPDLVLSLLKVLISRHFRIGTSREAHNNNSHLPVEWKPVWILSCRPLKPMGTMDQRIYRWGKYMSICFVTCSVVR